MDDIFKEYARTHGLWYVENAGRASICFTNGADLLIEVLIDGADWAVHAWDAESGVLRCRNPVDWYGLGAESGRELTLASQQSIAEFLTQALAADLRVLEVPVVKILGKAVGSMSELQARVGHEWVTIPIEEPLE